MVLGEDRLCVGLSAAEGGTVERMGPGRAAVNVAACAVSVTLGEGVSDERVAKFGGLVV